MQKAMLFTLMSSVLVWWAVPCLADGVEEDPVAAAREASREICRRSVARAADTMLARGELSPVHLQRFHRWLMKVILEEAVNFSDASERRDAVRSFVGAQRHEELVKLSMDELKSANATRRKAALEMLGANLFATDAVGVVRGFVFTDDPLLQLHALEAGAALDEPGCALLLQQAVLSKLHHDFELARSARVLYLCRARELDALAKKIVLDESRSAALVEEMIRPLKGAKDYHEVMVTLFLSDRFRPPTRMPLTLEEQFMLSVERKCLASAGAIAKDVRTDSAARRKLIEYARSELHPVLYFSAITVLERAGEPIQFFEELERNADENTRAWIETAVGLAPGIGGAESPLAGERV